MTIDRKTLSLLLLAKGALSFTTIWNSYQCGNGIHHSFKPAVGDQIFPSQWSPTLLFASSSQKPSRAIRFKRRVSWVDEEATTPPASELVSVDGGEGEIPFYDHNEDYATLVEEMAESIDLTRENAKLDSLNSYLLVSCLTATASFDIVKDLQLEDLAAADVRIIHSLAIVTASLGTLAGIYATVVFSLCSTVSQETLHVQEICALSYFLIFHNNDSMDIHR
jgi:hypothetical protein